MEGAALEQLGATAVPTPILKVTSGIISGELDAASVSLAPLADYGTKRVTTYHYMLATSGAPLLLLMNRKKFEIAAANRCRTSSANTAANGPRSALPKPTWPSTVRNSSN